jgi:hypothetical protein
MFAVILVIDLLMVILPLVLLSTRFRGLAIGAGKNIFMGDKAKRYAALQ